MCLFPRASKPALGPTLLKPYMIGRFFLRGWPGCEAKFHPYLILSERMSCGITTTPPPQYAIMKLYFVQHRDKSAFYLFISLIHRCF